MSSANLDRLTTFTRELADIACRIAQARCGLAPDAAAEFGLQLSQEVCNEFKGEIIYVGANYLAKVDERDREMLALYVASGRNIEVVMEKFDVCMQTAYKRVRLAEAAAYALRQGVLFPPGDADGQG